MLGVLKLPDTTNIFQNLILAPLSICSLTLMHQETYQNTFTDPLLFAAHAFETDEGATNKAECRVFWHLFAGSAGLPVIVLEDDIVVVWELEKAGGNPLRVLHKQVLKWRRKI